MMSVRRFILTNFFLLHLCLYQNIIYSLDHHILRPLSLSHTALWKYLWTGFRVLHLSHKFETRWSPVAALKVTLHRPCVTGVYVCVRLYFGSSCCLQHETSVTSLPCRPSLSGDATEGLQQPVQSCSLFLTSGIRVSGQLKSITWVTLWPLPCTGLLFSFLWWRHSSEPSRLHESSLLCTYVCVRVRTYA